MAWRYSAVQNVALFASVVPLAPAVLLADTLDGYPYLLCAALGVAVAFGLRGLRVHLHRRSAAFVAGEVAPEHTPGGFLLWLAPPLWCIALGLLTNAFLDPSPPISHPSEVLRRVNTQKGADRLVLRGFRPGQPELSLREGLLVRGGLAVGQPVTITVHTGLFGWARISSVTPR